MAGILLSSSVSGAVAVAWRRRGVAGARQPPIRVLVPLAAAVLVLSTFAAGNNRYCESPLERFGTASSNSGTADATLQTRIDSYEAAWDTIQSSPLVGVGLAREGADTPTGLAVHNLFLAAWYQAGLFGLIGVLLVAGSALAAGWKAMLAARRPGGAGHGPGPVRRCAGVPAVRSGAANPVPALRVDLGGAGDCAARLSSARRPPLAPTVPARADAGLARVAAAT